MLPLTHRYYILDADSDVHRCHVTANWDVVTVVSAWSAVFINTVRVIDYEEFWKVDGHDH